MRDVSRETGIARLRPLPRCGVSRETRKPGNFHIWQRLALCRRSFRTKFISRSGRADPKVVADLGAARSATSDGRGQRLFAGKQIVEPHSVRGKSEGRCR